MSYGFGNTESDAEAYEEALVALHLPNQLETEVRDMALGQVLAPHPVKHLGWIGRRLPVHCTAAGKPLLAHQPREVLDRNVDFAVDTVREGRSAAAELEHPRALVHPVVQLLDQDERQDRREDGPEQAGLGDVDVELLDLAGELFHVVPVALLDVEVRAAGDGELGRELRVDREQQALAGQRDRQDPDPRRAGDRRAWLLSRSSA